MNQEVTDVYVYQHRTADAGRIFYVGKGRLRRYKTAVGRSDKWHSVADVHGFNPEIVASGMDNELAMLAEQELIDVYKRRGIQLANISLGGQGCYGYKHSPEHIARLRGNKFSVGKPSHFKGKRHSEEAKKKMSDVRRGRDCGKWKGKTRSLESRLRMSAAKKGKPHPWARKLTDEQVKEIRETLGYRQIAEFARRYGVGESTIRRIRDSVYYKDPENV